MSCWKIINEGLSEGLSFNYFLYHQLCLEYLFVGNFQSQIHNCLLKYQSAILTKVFKLLYSICGPKPCMLNRGIFNYITSGKSPVGPLSTPVVNIDLLALTNFNGPLVYVYRHETSS